MADEPETVPEPKTDDELLGPEGLKALDAFKARARDAEKAAKAERKRADDAESELVKLREASQTDTEKALDKARTDAAKEAGASERQKWSGLIAAARVESLAGQAGFTDPTDAARFLDMAEFPVDEQGEVDVKAVTKALVELLDRKPHLRAAASPAVNGGFDGGARPQSSGSSLAAGADRWTRTHQRRPPPT